MVSAYAIFWSSAINALARNNVGSALDKELLGPTT